MGHDRHHERQKDVIDGNGVKQHPGQEQDDVDHEEYDPFVVRDGEQNGRSLFHQTHGGGHPGVEAGAGHHDHDHGRGLHGGGENLENDLQAVDGAVDEDAHEQPVKNGHGRGFRWREHAAVNPAEDDDRREHSPQRLAERPAHGEVRFSAAVAVPLRDDEHCPHDEQRHHHAGDKPGREQRRHRDFGHAAVHDKGDARRDHNGQTRGHGHGRGGKGLVVTRFGHARNKDQPERGHRGRARAAHRAPEGGDSHCGHGKSAGHGSRQRLHERDDARRNAGPLHDVAREDEEGNGQQRKLGDAGVEVVGEHLKAHVPAPHHHQRGQPQRQGDGHTDEQGDDEKRQHPEGGIMQQGGVHDQHLPSRGSARKSPRERCSIRKMTSSENSGVAMVYHHTGMPRDSDVTSRLISSSTSSAPA